MSALHSNHVTLLPVVTHLYIDVPGGVGRQIVLDRVQVIAAEPQAVYRIRDSEQQLPQGLLLKKRAEDLLVEMDGQLLLRINDFYVADLQAEFDLGAVNMSEPEHVTSDASEPAVADTQQATWTVQQESDSGLGWAVKPLLGLAGVPVLMGRDDDGNDNAQSAPASNTVQGQIVGGPVLASSDLTVDIFSADGNTLLAQTVLEENGRFQVDLGDYTGVVLVKVINQGSQPDYLDEATGEGKDLNVQLFSVGVVSEPNADISLNVNVVTTLAYQKLMQMLAAGKVPDAATVNQINQQLANLLGLDDLHTTEVVPINGGVEYQPADGLNAGERYGNLLAALSGADSNNGGDSQATLDALVNQVALDGDILTLAPQGLSLLLDGAQAADPANQIMLVDSVSDATSQASNAIRFDDIAIDNIINAQEKSQTIIRGSNIAGASVQLMFGEQQREAHVDGESWSYQLTAADIAAMGEGSEALTAQAVIGEQSARAVRGIYIDTILPAIPELESARMLNDRTPLLQGTADAGSAVTVEVAGALFKAVNDKGQWRLDTEQAVSLSGKFTGLIEGDNPLVMTVTDIAGNRSVGNALLTLDRTPPEAPVLAGNGRVNQSSPRFSGTAEAGSDMVLRVADAAFLTTVADNGDWQIDTALTQPIEGQFGGLTEGENALKLIVADASGNIAYVVGSTILDSLPPLPGILQFVNFIDSAEGGDGITHDNNFDLSLAGQESGSVVGYEVSTDAGVNWNATTVAQTALADGAYQFRAMVKDVAGNMSPSNVLNVTIDATPPVAGNLSLANFSDSGNNSDGITSDNNFDLSLVGQESGSVVGYEVSTDAGVNWNATTVAQTALADGAYQFRAMVKDVAGNSSPSNVLNVTIDATPPVAGSLNLANFVDSGNTSDGITHDNNFDLSLAGQEIGSAVVYEVSTDAGVNWNATTASQTALADGAYQFRAMVKDVAGNTSPSNVLTVIIDATPPTSGSLSLANFSDSGNTSDGITHDNNFDLSLAGQEPGSVVGYEVSTDAGVNWNATTATQTALADGDYQFRAVVKDVAGNVLPSNVLNVTIDATPPVVGSLSLANFGDSGNTSDGITHDNNFDLSLAGQETGSAVAYEVSTDAGVNWNATTATQTALADGNYQFRALVKDVAGNTSPSNVVNVTIDAAPPASGNLSLANFADSGNASDGITHDNNFDLSLAGQETGSVVAYEVSTDAGVNWNATTATQTALADGDYQFRAVVKDVAGNVLPSNVLNVTIDATPPVVGSLSLANFGDSGNTSDGITHDNNFDLSLAGQETGSAVAYEVSTDAGVNWNATTATQTALADGNYQFRALVKDVAGNTSPSNVVNVTIDAAPPASGNLSLANFADSGNASDGITHDNNFDLSLAGQETGSVVAYEVSTDAGVNWNATTASQSSLADGNYQFRAMVKDVAGNMSPSNVLNVTIDATPPVAGSLNLANFVDSGNTSDGITHDNNFDLSLAGQESGSVVAYEVSTDAGVNWNATTASQSSLADGNYQFRAMVKDVAGNSSPSNVVSVTIDATPPVAGSLSLANFTDSGNTSDGITSDNNFDLNLVGHETGSAVAYEVSTDAGVNWNTTTATQTALADGAYQFRAMVKDVAGNMSPSNVLNVTIDATPPVAGSLNLANFVDSGNTSDGITHDNNFDLSLAGQESGSVVGYEVSTDAGVNWNATSATQTALADGDYQFRAMVKDVAGNSSPSNILNVTIDATPPVVGSLSLANFGDSGNTSDGITHDNNFDLSLAGQETGSAVAYEVSTDAGANWNATTATQTALADGAYQFRAVVQDVAGNTSPSNVVSVTIDATPPVAGNLSLANFSDSGNTGDGITNDQAFDLSLAGQEPGSVVGYEVSTDAGVNWNATTVAQTALADGDYQFRAVVKDVAGNMSPSNVLNVTIDATPPVAGSLNLANFVDSGNNSDGVTNDQAFDLSLVDQETGSVVAYEVSTDAGANWNATTATQTALADGAYQFRAMVKDVAGNSLPSNVVNVTIDATPPTSGILSLANFADSGNASDGITNDQAFDLSLAGQETGSAVAYEVSTDNGVNWEVTSATQTALADGAYQFRAMVKDVAGNTSPSNVVNVTIDATPPTSGSLSLANFIDSGNTSDGVTNDQAFDLSLVDQETGSAVAYEVSTDAGVNWNATTSTQTALADGDYQFRAMVKDVAGNTSPSNVLNVTIDAAPPVAGSLSLANFADSGNTSDGVTNDQAFDLSLVDQETGSAVAYEVSTDAGVNWNATTSTQTALADGDYQFRAMVKDVAGNTSPSNVLNVTIDAAPPVAGSLSLANFADSGNTSDGVTNDQAFDLSLAGQETGSAVAYEVSTDNGVNWEVTSATQTALADGAYQFRAMVKDVAGNTSPSNVLTVTIDATPPTSGILSLANFADSGNASDGITNDQAFDLSLAGQETGSAVAYEVSTDNGVNWEVTSATQTALADGAYQFRAMVKDVAGNTSPSNVVNVTIDATPPTSGSLSLANFGDSGNTSDGITHDNNFDLSLAGQEIGSAVVYEVSTDAGVNWNATTASQTALADGDYQFRAMVKDVAGNSLPSNVVNVTIDATPPTSGILSLANFADSGNASDGITNDQAFDLSLAGQETGSAVAYEVSTDNGVNWEVTSATQTALADGAYQFRAMVKDVAGNTSPSNVVNVTIDATPPTSGILSLANFADSGNASDGITNDQAFDLSLAGQETGSAVAYEVSTDAGVNWNATTVAQTALADGDYQFRAVVKDVAGNMSPSNVLNVIVDATLPAAGSLSLANFIDSGNTSDGVTNDQAFDLSLVDQETGSVVAYEVSTDAGVNWNATTVAQTALADGDYQFRAVVKDVAGNMSPSNVLNVTIDATPPVAGSLNLANFVDSGNNSDGVTNDNSFDLHLTGHEATGSVLYQVSTDGGSNWNATTAVQTSLADGDYQFRAMVADAAGTTSISNALNVTIDATLPVAGDLSVVNLIDSGVNNGDAITHDNTFDLTLSGNETGSSVIYEMSTDGGASWSVTTATQNGLADGDYQFRADVSDVAGNTAVAKAINIKLDATAPITQLIGPSTVPKQLDAASPGGDDSSPQIATLGNNGSYVVSWGYQDSIEGDWSVFVQKVNADGSNANSLVKLEALGVVQGDDVNQKVIAIGDAGAYVVVWNGIDTNLGAKDKIYMQRFLPDGSVDGGIVQLDTLHSNAGSWPYEEGRFPDIVQVASNGEYVVAWEGWFWTGSEWDTQLSVQKFAADGTAKSSPVQLDATDAAIVGNNLNVDIAAIGNSGEYVVAWQGAASGQPEKIFLQRFNADGSMNGGSLMFEGGRGLANQSPQVTPLGTEGDFVVSWAGRDPDGDLSIFVQKVVAGSDSVNEPQMLEATGYTGGDDVEPRIVALGSNGEYAVTWLGFDAVGGAVYVQKFSTDGSLQGEAVKLNGSGTINDPETPQVLALGTAGDYLVTWSDIDGDGDSSVFIQRFNPDGSPNGTMMQLEPPAVLNGVDTLPVVSQMGESGEFALAWQGANGQGNSIWVQKFNADGSLQPSGGIQLSMDTGISGTDFVTYSVVQTITARLSAALGAGEYVYASLDNGNSWQDVTGKVTGTLLNWDGAVLSGTNTIKLEVRDDAGNVSNSLVQDYVLDVLTPTFSSTPTATPIDENSGINPLVYTAISSESNVSYSLKPADDYASFAIDATTGQVSLLVNPDYESQSIYNFTVQATDRAGNVGEQALTLTINDLDEAAPSITSGITATALAENSGANQLVYTATSTDTGDTNTGSTSYSLKAVDDFASFSIDATSGEVTLNDNPDYETQASYSFTVVATDAAGNSSEQLVTQQITNLDEVAPTFTSGATIVALNENSGANQSVYTATSTDTGDTNTGSTSYSLKAVGDAASFSIDSSTGVVHLVGNPDYEAKSSYNFTVLATDAAGNSSEQVVTQQITNLDEVAPSITSGATATSLADSSGVNQLVYTATSSDVADTVTGNTSYSLKLGKDSASFTIDNASGAVRLSDNPDYATKASYDFTVVASDTAGNSSEQAVSLAISSPSIVVFDLVEGVSSEHSSRVFSSNESYTIYLRVDSDTSSLSTDGIGPGPADSWGIWSGASSLGLDDKVVLVGSGSEVLHETGVPVVKHLATITLNAWQTASNVSAVQMTNNGLLSRHTKSGSQTVELWSSSFYNMNSIREFSQVYAPQLTHSILVSQGLAV